jgi:hypothetical protein
MRQISPKQREDSFAIDHREPVSHYKRWMFLYGLQNPKMIL